MEANFGERLTREKLAQLAGLRPEHYSRLFKQYKLKSPIDYLTELRIQAAKLLLRRRDLTVRQVARAVGFEDPYYFSRRFSLHTGMAPSEYKRQPQLRVVAVDYYGHLRALGIRPVGVSAGMVGLKGLHADWSEDAVDIGIDDFPYYDLAAVERLQPDAICVPVSWMKREQSEALLVEADTKKDPLYSQFKVIGAALGLDKQVEDWLRMYEERSSALRRRLEARMGGQSIAILRIRTAYIQIYGNEIMGYGVYKSLGLTPPPKLAKQFEINGNYHSTVISLEELPFYHADHLIVVVQPDEETEQLWMDIQKSSVWLDFPAVRKGHIYRVDVHRWLAYDPLSIMAQMEEAAELLGASCVEE
ncbi:MULTISPECIES: helix-turn-helix domain-containing protein [unclassified Paenibacillus]|uniref:helix-turn-helix domain-containing protein n=1 Tax=unclassified Paenibacillus TaxID=185978 RepID=UPI00092FE380|nr:MULTISPECIES: helix-turn-helix domain-containing protein [unclassified Paenibacillus]